MKEEHTPTIIQLILSTDLAVIQLKDSHLILHISQQFSLLFRKQTNSCEFVYPLDIEEKIQLRGKRLTVILSSESRVKVKLG